MDAALTIAATTIASPTMVFLAIAVAVFGAMVSHLAAPVIRRAAVPGARLSRSLTRSPGQTPFSTLVIGLPLSLAAATWLAS